jgi:hypothetical protein
LRESFAPLAVVEGRGTNEASAELLAASIADPSANSLWQLVLQRANSRLDNNQIEVTLKSNEGQI